jgi:hypothetical protein
LISLFIKSDRNIHFANHQMKNNSNFGPIIENAIDADIATITEI